MNNTIRFLENLFIDTASAYPEHYLELTLLDDLHKDEAPEWEGGKKRKSETGWLRMDKIDELPAWLARLEKWNTRGYGVYFGAGARHEKRPPGKRALKSSVSILPALWLDMDCGGDRVTWATERLTRFVTPPTMIVSTGGGVQAWWVLREPFVIGNESDRLNFEHVLSGLAKTLDGDTAVADVARIMRLPGFANMKPDRGGYVAKVEYEVGDLYDYGSFAGYAALANPPRPQQITRQYHHREGKRPRLTNRAENYLSVGEPQGQRHQGLMHTAFQMKEKGFTFQECWEEAGRAAMNCGLPEPEASSVIAWVYQQ